MKAEALRVEITKTVDYNLRREETTQYEANVYYSDQSSTLAFIDLKKMAEIGRFFLEYVERETKKGGKHE